MYEPSSSLSERDKLSISFLVSLTFYFIPLYISLSTSYLFTLLICLFLSESISSINFTTFLLFLKVHSQIYFIYSYTPLTFLVFRLPPSFLLLLATIYYSLFIIYYLLSTIYPSPHIQTSPHYTSLSQNPQPPHLLHPPLNFLSHSSSLITLTLFLLLLLPFFFSSSLFLLFLHLPIEKQNTFKQTLSYSLRSTSKKKKRS